MSIWKRKDKSQQPVDTTGGYTLAGSFIERRGKLLEGDPAEQGWTAHDIEGIWAAAMEMAMPKAIATLAMAVDGAAGMDVNFYFSNGGGILGAGDHDGPRQAGREFLCASSRLLSQASPTTDFPLPTPGRIRFYIRTPNGTYTAEADEASLANQTHPLSELFGRGHDVITQMRLVTPLDQPASRSAPGATTAPTSPPPPPFTGPALEVSVLRNGETLADGVLVSLGELDGRLAETAKSNGGVWYYREGPLDAEPPQVAKAVVDLIAGHRLPISFSSKPDFSDIVNVRTGESVPRC